MGLEPIADDQLRRFVGPPPKMTYQMIYGLDEATALECVKYHREYGKTKAYLEADVYEAIPELLDELRKRGYMLAVATLKKEKIAYQVLEHAGIADRFNAIVGMNDEETLTKCDTLKIAIDKTGADYCLLIGDSIFDYEGAKAAGVDFVGVTYGFGFTPDEKYEFETVDKLTVEDFLSKLLPA